MSIVTNISIHDIISAKAAHWNRLQIVASRLQNKAWMLNVERSVRTECSIEHSPWTECSTSNIHALFCDLERTSVIDYTTRPTKQVSGFSGVISLLLAMFSTSFFYFVLQFEPFKWSFTFLWVFFEALFLKTFLETIYEIKYIPKYPNYSCRHRIDVEVAATY